METKLKRIAEHSRGNPKMKFGYLIQHLNRENLISCFYQLNRNKAVGVDQKTWYNYEEKLEGNIEDLIQRMKIFRYYPQPVREVLIPKSNGKSRPLGISTIEDKIVQLMYSKILNAIYEPLFSEKSFGFRPGRSCHDAIKNLRNHLNSHREGYVLDLDLENFFGSIDQRKLIQLLELKIEDRSFIRYIVRMLKAGILTEGKLKVSEEGCPQGSIVSPILANIFAHYALDIWIEKEIPKYLFGKIYSLRYADDQILWVSDKRDVDRVLKALKSRLARFSLKLNEDKTKVIHFSKAPVGNAKVLCQNIFDFLGFSFYVGKSRKGIRIVKLKTSSKTFRVKLKSIGEWCKRSRHKGRLNGLWKIFCAKLRGHINYYGVSFNSRSITLFRLLAIGQFFKWMNRRSQRKSFNWKKFYLYMENYPAPEAKVVVSLY